MAGKVIYLFMWGYQESYRLIVQRLVRDVLKKLGAPIDAEVLLVGVSHPDSKKENPVCVEPEYGKWKLSLFDELVRDFEENYKNNPLQNVFYGDAPSMRDKPERMRRDSVRMAVANALEVFDAEHGVMSFCGEARCVNGYYVTPVVQIPNETFVKFPALINNFQGNEYKKSGFCSFIHAAVSAVLREATRELQNPEPGRFAYDSMRDVEELVRIAARDLLYTPGLLIERSYMYGDLFDALNNVSSLMYEGARGIGQIILVDPDSDAVEYLVKFIEPVNFSDPRWVRKILQMATEDVGVIANSERIYGLGALKSWHDASAQDAFTVNFIDHYHWELCCGDQKLLRSRYAVPRLPQEPFNQEDFLANYARLFPGASRDDGRSLLELVLLQIIQDHGSMIVISEDAANEACRLGKQGTKIVPTQLNEALFRSASKVDGAILLDPMGVCHAVGIILDGEAIDQCTPSRGARYNSGIRYVQASKSRRLAIVVSEDKTVDIIPRIRKLVSRLKIEQYVTAFEAATVDNYLESRNWLDSHRFYISAEQCSRINDAIDRLDSSPKDVGSIYLMTMKFEVHPEMDESYLTD